MKLTKKLLTVLPIAAIGVSTPIVVSGCSCSNGYTINYGDAIDCKNQNEKNYHSIDQVKSSSKNHVQIEDECKKSEEQLMQWSDPTSHEILSANHQFFYWDLVYSTACSNIAFTLTWTITETAKQKCDGGNFNGTSFKTLSYKFIDGKVSIVADDKNTLIASQAYQHVQKA